MYGARGRIGLMVPTGNTTMEPELNRMLPDGVSLHANRIYLENVTPLALRRMEAEAVASANGLVACGVGVIAFGCTSGSFVGGAGYDEGLIRLIEDATGIAATTTTSAVLRALQVLGAGRIAMATPYTDAVNDLEKTFLESQGVEVVRMAGGGLIETPEIQNCDPAVSLERARAVDHDRADAVFISCTGFRTIENLAQLEDALGKPVISANQCTLADCLRILGVQAVQPGFGSLFERVFAAAAPRPLEHAAG